MKIISSLCAAALVVVLTAVPASISGQTKDGPAPVFPGQTEGEFIVKDFHFKSGEVLPELTLHYVTLGTPHRNSAGEIDNAALLLHATAGGATSFLSHLQGPLFGPGQLKNGRCVIIATGKQGSGEAGNIANGELWGAHLQELLRSLPH